MPDQTLSPAELARQFGSTGGMTLEQYNAKMAQQAEEQNQSVMARLTEPFKRNLNPINMASGLARAVFHPLDTMGAMMKASDIQYDMAAQRLRDAENDPTLLGKAKNYIAAAGRTAAGTVPLVGPMLGQALSQAEGGDIAGAVGEVGSQLAPMLIDPALKFGARVSGIASIPNKVAEYGFGNLRTVKADYPTVDIGEMARKYLPTKKNVERNLNTIASQNDANLASVPASQYAINPQDIANGAADYAWKKSMVDTPSADQANQLNAMSDYVQRFMDSANRPQSLSEVRAIGKKAGASVNWARENAGLDPTRMTEYMGQGVNLASRDLLEQGAEANNLPSVKAALQEQQRLMALKDAIYNRSLSSNTLRRDYEAVQTMQNPARGLASTILLEGMRNPVVTSILGNMMDWAGGMATSPAMMQLSQMLHNSTNPGQ